MNRKTWMAAIVLAVTAASTPAFAAGVGLHAGMTIDPDNFLIGVRWNFPMAEPPINIVPSVEAGFGDITMIAGNLDAHYVFQTGDVQPYVGGGITLNWFDFEGDSSTEFGGSILGGVKFNPTWGAEAKIGLGDVPDAKVMVVYTMP
jgi:hypothetical protein